MSTMSLAGGLSPAEGRAGLSEIQQRMYAFICDYQQEQGRPPTIREIGEALGIQSTGHVDYHLKALQQKGWISRDRHKSRGITVSNQDQRGPRIIGSIAAGVPLDIFADGQSDVLDMSRHAHGYVLQVRGLSMIEDHITDGDYVLIDPDASIRNGDLIVATHKTATGERGAATLKRLFRRQGRVQLQPANATMQPIFIEATDWDNEWEVQGRVTAVYRKG